MHAYQCTGPLCGVCNSPDFELSNFRCIPCSNSQSTLIAVLVIGIPFVLFILYIASWRPMFIDHSSDDGDGAGNGNNMRTARGRAVDPMPIRSAIMSIFKKRCFGSRTQRVQPRGQQATQGSKPSKNSIFVMSFVYLKMIWTENSLGIALKVCLFWGSVRVYPPCTCACAHNACPCQRARALVYTQIVQVYL
jgi:hypothetical protein